MTVALWARNVAAQTEPPDRWKISAEFSLTDQSGNKTLRLLTGGLNVSHLQRDEYRLDGSIESRYGRSDGELVALSQSASLAFDLQPRSSWTPFLSTDAERDEFKRLDLRLSSGAGLKHTFYSAGFEETSLSLAMLYSYQRIGPSRTGEAQPPAGIVEVNHSARWSLRARTDHELRDGITLRHTTFYQPIWDDVANYLLRSETGLKILLTERLALSVDYQLKRDARPPDGVEPNDRLLKTGLIIDF
ncbi:MAG TPA: DUF481 domain-containing protein [Longimicrobiaceae bacterium]|nr:DUF481 domain-containing protein [Longimicrobiaceae bacterium]